MGDFGSEQGLSDFETAGIAGYSEDFKRAKTPLWAKRCRFPPGARPQMVGFGSEQGLSEFETGGVAWLRRGFQKSENAALGQKMPFVDGHYLTVKVALKLSGANELSLLKELILLESITYNLGPTCFL